MRQNVFFSASTLQRFISRPARYRYFLRPHPRIQEMNDILGKIEWGAGSQWTGSFRRPRSWNSAYKVLGDRVRHAPDPSYRIHSGADIVHEAAGPRADHFDREYSKIPPAIRRSRSEANVVDKKISSSMKRSATCPILKGNRTATRRSREATKLVETRQRNLGEPSEWRCFAFALVDGRIRIIGALENPKIYGAGLLSSIGESVFVPRAGGEKDPLLHRCDESAVRHHHETATAVRLS